MARKIVRYRIEYYDESRSPDVVVVGLWEFTQAERKFGVGCIQNGSLDANLYAAFLGAQRSGLTSDLPYDTWGAAVAVIDDITDEAAAPGESAAPPRLARRRR